MSVWPTPGFVPGLRGAEGVLLSVRIAVEPRHLEDLLDTLSGVSFPINPEIHHPAPAYAGHRPLALVEFPAYENRVEEVREALRRRGFDAASARIVSMLEAIEGSGEKALFS